MKEGGTVHEVGKEAIAECELVKCDLAHARVVSLRSSSALVTEDSILMDFLETLQT